VVRKSNSTGHLTSENKNFTGTKNTNTETDSDMKLSRHLRDIGKTSAFVPPIPAQIRSGEIKRIFDKTRKILILK
jgi:hypothetical protein